MIQEYLLIDAKEKEEINKYTVKSIKKKFYSFDNGNSMYVQYLSEGESESIAKLFSEVDVYIRNNFHVTCLTDECSAFFCKQLYPMISAFEYSMRKLLYIFCALHHDEKTNERLSGLESKDFGAIFTTLFVDESFMLEVKKSINNRSIEYYTKQEVIESIKSLQENTLWDQLMGATIVPTLRNKHGLVREYRNDVMHSHNITWEKYQKIQELYTQINKELIEAIQNIETTENKERDYVLVNMKLDKILQPQNYLKYLVTPDSPYVTLQQQIAPLLEQQNKWKNIVAPDSPYVTLQQQIASLLEQQNKWKDLLKATPEQLNIFKSFIETDNKQTMQNPDGLKDALQQAKDSNGLHSLLDATNNDSNNSHDNDEK